MSSLEDVEPDPDSTNAADDEPVDDHLSGLEAGAGCTEIWEHLSERRERANSD